MVCQKERHADPILSLLHVSTPGFTEKALLTGMETYEAAMALRDLLSQRDLDDHICIFSSVNDHCINNLVFGSSSSRRLEDKERSFASARIRKAPDLN